MAAGSRSGWEEEGVEDGYVDVADYDAFAGDSYIPLLHDLGAKKAIVNVKNTDNACFRWALKSALFPVSKNAERPSNKYPQDDGLNWEGIEFPVNVPQISQFENQNPCLAINVLAGRRGIFQFCTSAGKTKRSPAST